MADVAITPEAITMHTRTSDLVALGTVIAAATANVFIIAVGARHGDRILLLFEADATGDTVTILAGDRPPSQRAGLGDITIVLAASDLRGVCVEAARFVQDDGSIHATCGDDGTRCSALILPRN